MAIFAIGAFYDRDVSSDFINHNLVGVGWSEPDAPALHRFIRSLKVGDIVYIKSFSPRAPDIHVKAIGVVRDDQVLTSRALSLISIGRHIRWVTTQEFRIPKPQEKNNVRANTMYEEFHPQVQNIILGRLLAALGPTGAV